MISDPYVLLDETVSFDVGEEEPTDEETKNMDLLEEKVEALSQRTRGRRVSLQLIVRDLGPRSSS